MKLNVFCWKARFLSLQAVFLVRKRSLMRFPCKLMPLINAWTGNKKETRRDCWLFSRSSFQNNMFPLVLKCCGFMKSHKPQKHESFTNSQTGNTYLGPISVGSKRTTMLFQVTGVRSSRNMEEYPLYVKVRPWHRLILVLRLKKWKLKKIFNRCLW